MVVQYTHKIKISAAVLWNLVEPQHFAGAGASTVLCLTDVNYKLKGKVPFDFRRRKKYFSSSDWSTHKIITELKGIIPYDSDYKIHDRHDVNVYIFVGNGSSKFPLEEGSENFAYLIWLA
jgi:hypothetical protein